MSHYEPFPLTEVQEAYWVGRQARSQGGNVSAHLYMELEADGLDLERLECAWRGVVDRHEMLRAVVRPDGRQIVLPEVPAYEIEIDDLRDVSDAERDAKLRATRERLSAQVLPSDVWPLWEIRASRLSGVRVRVHWSMDLLMIDGGSIAIVLREWARRYAEGSLELAPLETTFREYVLAVDELTSREHDVLVLIGRGLSNSEIAAELGISEVTVKSHVGRIFVKLDLRDRAAAIVYAFDHRIVTPR